MYSSYSSIITHLAKLASEKGGNNIILYKCYTIFSIKRYYGDYLQIKYLPKLW